MPKFGAAPGGGSRKANFSEKLPKTGQKIPKLQKKKSGKKSKKELRKFKEKLRKITPFEWEKWGIELPLVADGPPSRLLNSAEIRVIERTFEKSRKSPSEAPVRELVVVTEKQFENQDRVEKLRQEIITEYTGTVFRDKLPKDPPIRGMHGLAYIPLKDDATPTRQGGYPMQGDKKLAYKK